MKKYLRFSTVIFAILALLLSTFPASAAEKIPINGTCIVIAFPPYFGDLDQSPDYRYWIKPDGMEHWRNQVILFTCDFNDDRLDGYFLALDNWNTNMNESSNFYARTFGSSGYVSDELGNDLGLWDATGVGFTEKEGTWGVNMIYKGRGLYQGLSARTSWTSPGFPIYSIEGELLIP